ncbi:complement C4-B-like isoform X1 [Poecilia formosa]|uniref:complement C4-B-like isoform X1 n=2 Tax=Poecilia TaxID=8080 RepID=UPI000443A93D|nr:PREDICTED: complement C4-B-like isoform X1 [Poecilia formosa]
MKWSLVSLLLLISILKDTLGERFFISAPSVFHVGVKEKVLVQMGGKYLNKHVSVYLEDQGMLMSEKKKTRCTTEEDMNIVELMIDRETWQQSKRRTSERPYLDLVAEVSDDRARKITKVLVSNHRGYIFIQTDQPMYNPTQKVNYRIFTLNHMFRPHEGTVCISVFNAAGNKIMNTLKRAEGILKGSFPIPSVSESGTFKITAHYEDDEAKAAVREFKVQKFVLPSFEVSIETERRYILLNDQEFNFTISAMYSYGERVKGAFHCQFGFVKKGQKAPHIISGLEKTGSITDGRGSATLQLKDIDWTQLNQTLADLQSSGSQLYVGVFVTNIQNGEVQEEQLYLPIVPHKYSIDLSRTRSYYVPRYPIEVVAVVRHPDGTPAVGVPVTISIANHQASDVTNEYGGAYSAFNFNPTSPVRVDVSAGGLQMSQIIKPASSPTESYLYISLTNKVYHVGEELSLTFLTPTVPNHRGHIYYMVLSRGMIITKGSLLHGTRTVGRVVITADMVPSFRLIGYYHGNNGDIIADSVWVDVRDECEIKVAVQHDRQPVPGRQTKLNIDLHGQTAKVALLAVDKAFYGLKADNKLTAKQMFSTMASYDLGCKYTGGSNPAEVLIDAGLSFTSQTKSAWRQAFDCGSQNVRSRRAVDLNEEKRKMALEFEDAELKICCTHAFSHIPMNENTCETRSRRVLLVKKNQMCAAAFLKCCLAAEKLRKKKMREDLQIGLGRTATTDDIEEFFLDTANQYIRQFFPPSFEFREFLVTGKKSHTLTLPDSITTWEIQVVTLSSETGLCVVKPHELRAFKESFVTLRLPYSVKRFEQLFITPVIYNYGENDLQAAVHMEQTEGLCSPASATTTSFTEITVKNHSSQFVSFSVVPMVTGPIPIKIRLYDIGRENGIDALEKNLNVKTEGLVQRDEKTEVFYLDGRSSRTIYFDGAVPDNTVPDSNSNIFVSMEGNGFGESHAKNLLSPEIVSRLIVLPIGCLEQTMVRLAPTTLAIRYLDLSDQWFDLKAGARDDAFDKIEHGYVKLLSYKSRDGSFQGFYTVKSTNWGSALVVKVLSLVAERQTDGHGERGRVLKVVPEEEIRRPVRYLMSVQQSDGSFRDPEPMLHRDVLKGKDQDAAMTAFITLALIRSLPFHKAEDRNKVEATIRKATTYLASQLEELSHTYAVALTAYCLAVDQPKENNQLRAWEKLKSMATKDENGCYMWTNGTDSERQNAITVETTAYALLAAVKNNNTHWANLTACWLVRQENYKGGYRSTQDTNMALEALSEYELAKTTGSIVDVTAEFTVPGKNDILRLELKDGKEKVETDLQKLSGKNITIELRGQGNIKLKTVKAYHLLDSEEDCSKLNISVKVEGKVKYTEKIIENYDYYDDYDATEGKQTREARSAIDRFDALTRSRRDLENDVNSDSIVTYTVCVSYNPNSPLTGMGIADITLLSGFEVKVEDLERLTASPEQYISHYELSSGRLLMYFNKLYETRECVSFTANQMVPIGLLQPAPAVFYDYYEPDIKCTVFYSPSRRSKLVSTLCSEDVCQCAERPCHKVQETFKSNRFKNIRKNTRFEYACFSPRVDYAYILEVQDISVKSNFELYSTKVVDVLKYHGDLRVTTNSVRVFAKRLQCKGQLELGRQYLIMGKDGSTKDLTGNMQYLLESNTWVEKKPLDTDCKKSANTRTCNEFNEFIDEYKTDGCRQ